jgi:protein translocase SecG subunit
VEWFKTLLIVLQVISALAVIFLLVLQQGKGADMGAAFGSGSSGSFLVPVVLPTSFRIQLLFLQLFSLFAL